MATFIERIKNSWNAFMGRDPTYMVNNYMPLLSGSYCYGNRPDRYYLSYNNSKSVVSSIYNQIGIDVSSVTMNHVLTDEDGNFKSIVKDTLNEVLTYNGNVDQTGRELIKDLVISMCDEGCVALVPVDTDVDPSKTESFKVLTARTGKILEWFPKHVRLEVYNDITGKKQQIIIEKRIVPIMENPFYTVMNEQNSVAQRLKRVLGQLDRTNEKNSSGKIDMLIQLPYSTRREITKERAEGRRRDLENQLEGSKYGIGYIDATEKVIQLNRAVENNLWEQSKDLQSQLYNQLGFSEAIFNGTADEQTMINYYNRTIEPFLSTISMEIERKWLSRTAITQGHSIRFFRDSFRLMPNQQIAEIADKFTRNEIMTSNEIRAKIGMKPSKDPKADELRNSNLNHPDEKQQIQEKETIDQNS